MSTRKVFLHSLHVARRIAYEGVYDFRDNGALETKQVLSNLLHFISKKSAFSIPRNHQTAMAVALSR